jgi:hypothetical protein
MNVFISYRRRDTQDLAGRIADRLRAVPQIGQTFIDVDGIEPGTDFIARLKAALAESDVCLLLIGPDWRGQQGNAGGARILEGRDFVRLEAAAALASKRKILPVLANGATMPEPEQLPEELRPLTHLNALSIRHAYFEHDIEYLIDAVLSRRKPGRVGSYLKRHPIQAGLLRGVGGMLAGLLLLLAGAALHGSLTQRSLEESLHGPAQVWLLIAAVLAIGAGAAVLNPRRRRGDRRKSGLQ